MVISPQDSFLKDTQQRLVLNGQSSNAKNVIVCVQKDQF